MKILGKKIGPGAPVFVISEIGNNHNGSFEKARKMIRLSARSGADAVKFQTFRAGDIVSPLVPAGEYRGWKVGPRYSRWIDFLKTLELPLRRYPDLIKLSHDLGLAFISTPTSIETAEFLYSKKADALKIASMDVTNLPLLRGISGMNIPVIMSTGMAALKEIEEAVRLFNRSRIALLHCVSDYPMDPADANLRTIPFMRERFNLPVGFSDHSLGEEIDVWAVCAGAQLLEKHFTLNRKSPVKAEHHFSVEPGEMKRMVSRVRETEKTLGVYNKVLSGTESENRVKYRRSIFFVRDMKQGERIRSGDMVCLRPETSLKPRLWNSLFGKRVKKEIKAYEPFRLTDLSS